VQRQTGLSTWNLNKEISKPLLYKLSKSWERF